jgi:hypothetical protein
MKNFELSIPGGFVIAMMDLTLVIYLNERKDRIF